MKRIRLLRNLGAGYPPYKEGEEQDVQDHLADVLCGKKLAELIRAIPNKPLKAVPDKPQIEGTRSKKRTPATSEDSGQEAE